MTASGATRPIPERRRERRVPVHLPILVRGMDHSGEWFEERTSSLNLCRGGAAFATRYAVDPGSRLEINIPVFPSAGKPAGKATGEEKSEFSTQGRIVHVAPGANERERIVGVEFTGPRFNRMFVSEATS